MSILNKAKLGLVGTAVALGLTFTAGAASALPSVEGAFTSGFQQWSDNSGEVVYDKTGHAVSTIAVGDIFAGVVQISSFPTTNANASNYNALTAIFAVVVDSITAVPGSVCGNALITTCSAFTFSSDNSNLAALLQIGVTGGALGTFVVPGNPLLAVQNTIGAFYENNGNNGAFIDSGTIGSDLTQASSGTLRLTAGDTTGTDTWTGTGPTSLAQLGLNSQLQGSGGFSINESIMSQNFPGLVFGPNITGQGTISFNADNPFGVTDNTSFGVFITPIPEPVTLSLFGAGLIGAAGLRRRKKA